MNWKPGTGPVDPSGWAIRVTLGQLVQTLVLLASLIAAWYSLSSKVEQLSTETRLRMAMVERRLDRLEDMRRLGGANP